MKKNSFLSFVSSLVPGCGQMYQGYFKRGISVTGWFFGIALFSAMFNFGALSILLVPIWLFSFFDAYSLRNLTAQQRVLFLDDFVPPSRWVKNNVSTGKLRGKSGNLLGWGLILLGGVFLYNTLLLPILNQVFSFSPYLAEIIWRLPDFLFAAVIIGFGIWLLTRGKGTPQADAQQAEQTAEGNAFINMPPAAFVAAQPQHTIYAQPYAGYAQNVNPVPQPQNNQPGSNVAE